MKDGICFISLKIPKDFKKRTNFRQSHVDTMSFSQSLLGVNGGLGTNWGTFQELNTSEKAGCLLNKCLLVFPSSNCLESKRDKGL